MSAPSTHATRWELARIFRKDARCAAQCSRPRAHGPFCSDASAMRAGTSASWTAQRRKRARIVLRAFATCSSASAKTRSTTRYVSVRGLVESVHGLRVVSGAPERLHSCCPSASKEIDRFGAHEWLMRDAASKTPLIVVDESARPPCSGRGRRKVLRCNTPRV